MTIKLAVYAFIVPDVSNQIKSSGFNSLLDLASAFNVSRLDYCNAILVGLPKFTIALATATCTERSK